MACNVKMSDLANIKIASEQVQLYLRVLKVYQCNTPELHKIEQSKRLIKLWRSSQIRDPRTSKPLFLGLMCLTAG